MTAQIVDEFEYLNNDYEIISSKNDFLFDPIEYGLTPVPRCTACYRGYFCKFSIQNESLILSKLTIGVENDESHVWRGNTGFFEEDIGYWTYDGVNLPIDYTGGIIIGSNIKKEFVNIWWLNQPHFMENVVELIFNRGKLVNTIIHDEYLSEARKIIQKSTQIYKKAIGHYKGKEEVIIKLPYDVDVKSFTLLVKEIAFKDSKTTSINIFNKFRSKGYIGLDNKLYFGEYCDLFDLFSKKGYKNILETKYSIGTNPQLNSEIILSQNSGLDKLRDLYNKYQIGKIYLTW